LLSLFIASCVLPVDKVLKFCLIHKSFHFAVFTAPSALLFGTRLQSSAHKEVRSKRASSNSNFFLIQAMEKV